jgi:phosphoribosylglycinamide formyltransferase-1
VSRIVVLASGSGSNLQTLLDHKGDDWRVVGVVSDQPEALALQRAATVAVPHKIVRFSDRGDRSAFTAAICDAVDEFTPHFVVMAGFMRVLGPGAIARFPYRIINIHPSLLPAFKGAHGVRDALAYGVSVTGVTIHFVDEHLDHGPIIAQEAVPVLPGDDEASLHARLQAVEHRLLPRVVTQLAKGTLEVSGRIVKGTVST